MCLVLLALHQHPDYPLILAANRDEFHQRASLPMHLWPNGILAGKDLQAGGTWLAINRQGDFAVVTNYREVPAIVGQKSRGQLPLLWLEQPDIESFQRQLSRQDYAGFNLIVGKKDRLYYLSNRTTATTALIDGIHGLSNALLDDPWPKISHAKPLIQALCQKPFHPQDWFELLASQEPAPDNQLPNTGVSKEAERLLSSRFIQSADYGTQYSTLLLIDKHKRIRVYERRFDAQGQIIGEQTHGL